MLLEGALNRWVPFGQVRKLIDHDNRDPVRGKRGVEQSQCAIPGVGGNAREGLHVRQRRSNRFFGEECELPSTLLRCSEEEMRHLGPVDEHLQQAALTHPASTAHEHAKARRTVVHVIAHPAQRAGQCVQLLLPAHKATHCRSSVSLLILSSTILTFKIVS